MIELKFLFVEDTAIEPSKHSNNIFGGDYIFATQETAVYEKFVFIKTENEIMKVNVKCAKAFYRNGVIVVVENNRLQIYENNKLKSERDVSKYVEQINGFLSSEMLDKLENGEIKEDCFMADEMLIKTGNGYLYAGDSKIEMCDWEGGKCYVGHKDGVIVVGNKDNEGIVYIVDGEQVNVEEADSINMRVDEDRLESIMIRDVKFYDDMVVVKDNERNSYYKLGLLKMEKSREVVEYVIKDDVLVKKTNKDDVLVRKTNESIKESNPFSKLNPTLSKHKESYMDSFSKPDANKTSISKENVDSFEKLTSTNAKGKQNLFTFDKLVLNNSNNCNDFEASNNTNKYDGKVDETTRISETPTVKTQEPNKNAFNKRKEDNILNRDFKNNDSTNNTNNNKIDKNNDNTGKNNLTYREEKELNDFEKILANKIRNLEEKYNKLPDKLNKMPDYVYIPQRVDFSKLYKLLFTNRIDDYNKTLSMMIYKLEMYERISENEIKQAINYIDSRIAEIGRIKPVVNYTAGLPRKLYSCAFESGVSFDSLVESMKLVKVADKDIIINNTLAVNLTNKIKSTNTAVFTTNNTTGSNTIVSNTTGSNINGSNINGSNINGSNTNGSNTIVSNTNVSNTTGSNTNGSNTNVSNTNVSNTNVSNINGSNTTGSNTTGSNTTGSNTNVSNTNVSNTTGSSNSFNPNIITQAKNNLFNMSVNNTTNGSTINKPWITSSFGTNSSANSLFGVPDSANQGTNLEANRETSQWGGFMASSLTDYAKNLSKPIHGADNSTMGIKTGSENGATNTGSMSAFSKLRNSRSMFK